jgi:serine acetyltransferase
MGNYCTANGGVIGGNKGINDNIPTIGDFVSLQIGCKVYGKLSIGDNVILLQIQLFKKM